MEQTTKNCPRCGASLSADATSCFVCGAVARDEVTPAFPASQPMAPTQTYPVQPCQGTPAYGAAYPYSPVYAKPKKPKNRLPKKSRILALVMAIILTALCAGLTVFFFDGNGYMYTSYSKIYASGPENYSQAIDVEIYEILEGAVLDEFGSLRGNSLAEGVFDACTEEGISIPLGILFFVSMACLLVFVWLRACGVRIKKWPALVCAIVMVLAFTGAFLMIAIFTVRSWTSMYYGTLWLEEYRLNDYVDLKEVEKQIFERPGFGFYVCAGNCLAILAAAVVYTCIREKKAEQVAASQYAPAVPYAPVDTYMPPIPPVATPGATYVPAPASTETVNSAPTAFCGACGTQLSADAAFCPRCGTPRA